MLHIVFEHLTIPKHLYFPRNRQVPILGVTRGECLPYSLPVLSIRGPTSWVSRSFRTKRIALSRSPYFTRCVAVLPGAETMCRFSRTNIVKCCAPSVWRPLYPRGVYIVANCA